ncbi:hypothetical protein AB0C34_22290 [Nocardia sp. NPDC049220]|uniref:hypothetical protein n=1 Tax=Nocardia sp. NPDC049220 TaxID=3155273 RepID=UPI0033F9AAC4
MPDTHDRRRVLVTPVPERVARVTTVWNDLGEGRRFMISEHTDTEFELTIEHMRKVQQLSPIQIERLRSGGKSDSSAPTEH